MARTFIGELVLRLKDEMSGKANAAAKNLDTSVEKIQNAAKKLNATSWGGKFESHLQKLGASAKDIDAVRTAWINLESDIKSRNLSKALAGQEKTNFKTAALREFSDIHKAWEDHANRIEARSRKMGEVLKESFKPLLVAMGAYTGTHYAGMIGREGVTASAKWEREKFRGTMANIPKAEQDRLLDESEKLGVKYPSVGTTDIAEMARYARSMMGDTDRGLAILPDLVKGMVTLQSALDVDEAPGTMTSLLKGIDNAGKNNDGQLGIDSTRDIIAGMIRAAQVDSDVDPGKLFQFARRGKIAVPGLSTEFLANVSPAFMQDMTAEGFGTALSSAYQAFVIGASDKASKVNIARQREIGIRDDKGLVDPGLFGTDPYAWVKKNLIPALQNQGVDMNDNTAIGQEVARLTRNTNASGLLTRMITQQQQVDRLLEQYKNAMGPEAAEEARFKDPFVAWKGFIESLRNLAAALGEDAMPTIVAGLNSLANGINSLQQAWRDGDPMAKLGIAGAGIGAAVGTWKIAGAIWGLMTAGANLNSAAFALQAAAASLGGQGLVDDVAGGKKGSWPSKIKDMAPWLATLGARVGGPLGAAVATYEGLNSVPHDGYASVMKDNPNFLQDQERDRRLRAEYPGGFEGGMHTAGAGLGPRPGSWYPNLDHATTNSVSPDVDMGKVNAAANEASTAGRQIQDALSISATPTVNTAQLREAVALANQLKATLSGIGSSIASAQQSVSKSLGRSFTNHGVKP